MSESLPPPVEQEEHENGGTSAVFVLFAILIVVLVAVFAGSLSTTASSERNLASAPTADAAASIAEQAEVAAAPTLEAVVPTVEAAAPTIAAQPPTLEPTVAEVEATAETVAVADAGGAAQPVAYSDEDIAAGMQIFNGLCFACHGSDARGMPGLGKPLIGSQFVNGLTDAELVAFISVGRQPGDPLNTTGQTMPARGGNPSLTDTDLAHVVAYIRSLNQAEDERLANAALYTATPVNTPRPFVPLDLGSIDPNAVRPNAGSTAATATPAPGG